MSVEPTLLAEYWRILAKDLSVQRRDGRGLLEPLLIATGTVAICALAGGGRASGELAAGAVWVALTFSAILAAGQSYDLESRGGALTALRVAPVRATSIYLGKGTVILVQTMAGGLAAVLLSAVWIDGQALWNYPLVLVGCTASGCLGFALTTGLFAPMLASSAGREAYLTLIMLPLAVPLLISGARATTALYGAAADWAVVKQSMGLVLAFDGVALLLGLWFFEPLLRGGSSE